MTRRLVLPLMMLTALLLAPFGRVTAAEAMAMPHDAMAAADHCGDMAAPDEGKGDRTIDCLAACAAVTPAEAPPAAFMPAMAARPNAAAATGFAGIEPGADPPPPRLS